MSRAAPVPATAAPSLQRALDEFLDYLAVERRLSPHTLDAYRRDLSDLAAWMGQQGLDDWRRLRQETLRGYVAGAHRRGLSGKSLQRRLSAVRSFYRWLNRALTAELADSKTFGRDRWQP